MPYKKVKRNGRAFRVNIKSLEAPTIVSRFKGIFPIKTSTVRVWILWRFTLRWLWVNQTWENPRMIPIHHDFSQHTHVYARTHTHKFINMPFIWSQISIEKTYYLHMYFVSKFLVFQSNWYLCTNPLPWRSLYLSLINLISEESITWHHLQCWIQEELSHQI